jgi:outer membrane lipoprotein SlyB
MKRAAALSLAPTLLLLGCVTASTNSRTVEGPAPAQRRDGSVETVRETVLHTVGNPAAGAVAGAILGGLLGHAVLGGGGGAFVGAIGGAATGAAVSQGGAEDRSFEVYVRFDDGALGRFVYHGPPPWRSGDRVRETAGGLARLGPLPWNDSPPPFNERPTQAPPPPPLIPPPPDSFPSNDARGW